MTSNTTTTSNTAVTFRRAKSGEWVVCGPANRVRPGAVQVTRKDGTATVVVVERVGRPFTAGGRELRYGYLAADTAPARRGRRASSVYDEARRAYGRGHGPGCRCDVCFNEFDM